MSILPVALLLVPQVATETPAPPTLRQVEVELSSADDRRTVLREGFDLVHCSGPLDERTELLCTDADLERLDALGLGYRVIHEDAAAFYAERLARGLGEAGAAASGGTPALGAWLSPPFAQGSIGGYYSYDEVVSVLDQIAAAYPEVVSPKISLGQTFEGRGLWAVRVSDNPGVDEGEPQVRLDALHHAREPGSMQTVLWTLLHLAETYGTDPLTTWIVDNREIWVVPVVNPDGYAYNQATNPGGGGLWKKNRRDNGDGTIGVELNRNYPFQWGLDNFGSSGSTLSSFYRGTAPASEPEVAALVTLMEQRSFATALCCHTYSAFWMYPWAYTTDSPAALAEYVVLSERATEINGYIPGQASHLLYEANGVTIDHDHGVHGTFAWTPEIGGTSDGFYPPQARIVPIAEENRVGFLRTILAAGAAPYLVDEARLEVGDGDGRFEPGESVELTFTVQNAGVATSSTPVEVTVESGHPALQVVGPAVRSLGPLAPFAEAQSDALTLAIAPTATPGEVLDYEVRVTWEGCTESTASSLTLGALRPFVRDDLELDLGWIAGLPGDGAIGGVWEHGDPVGTSFDGEPLNPEDDATPGTEAVRCFTTGNGAGTPSGDDVDGGPTTLVSPAFHLASVESARVAYSRWFTDYGVNDDVLLVSISDDDGVSWTPLETVSQPSTWTERGFFVEDFVALTDGVRLRFVASDIPSNSILEAAVDDVRVDVLAGGARLNAYGSAAVGTPIALHVSGPSGSAYGILQSGGTGFLEFAQIAGSLLLDPADLAVLVQGQLPVDGLGRSVVPIPASAGLVGTTVYLQAIVAGPTGYELTNRDAVTFE